MVIGIIGLQFVSRVHAKNAIFRVALLVSGGTLIWLSLISAMFLAYIAALVFGASFSTLFMIGITMVQERVPDEDRGKAFAAFHTVSRVFLVLGAALAAGFASLVGRMVIDLGVVHISVWGTTIAMFIGGVLIAGVVFLPLANRSDVFGRD